MVKFETMFLGKKQKKKVEVGALKVCAIISEKDVKNVTRGIKKKVVRRNLSKTLGF